MGVARIRLASGELVFGNPSHFPPGMILASDRIGLPAAIRSLPVNKAAMGQLRAQWHTFCPGISARSLSDTGMMQHLTHMLRAKRLLILYLPTNGGSFVAPHLAPTGARNWGQADKVDKLAEALRRSVFFVDDSVKDTVAELVSPANLAIMVGFLIAVAIAQATGVAGAALNTVLIGLAWALAGFAGVKAIISFIGAIIDVMGAKTDKDIDAAARTFANAFVALGVAFLSRMIGKAKSTKSGSAQPKQTPQVKEKPKPVQGQQGTGPAKPPAKKTAAMLAAERRATAQDFYRKAGWSDEKIASHLDGIDFSKPVEVTTIPKGARVVQYQIPGRPTGNYFCPEGSNPSTLGFDTSGRVAKVFQAQEDIPVLRSTAADIADWNGSGAIFKGGSTQFFTPNGGAGLRAIGP